METIDFVWTDELVTEFHVSESERGLNIKRLEEKIEAFKQRKGVLAYTDDGKHPLREGDAYWIISALDGDILEGRASHSYGFYSPVFSTPESAFEWQIMNTPCIPLVDIIRIGNIIHPGDSPHIRALREFVKDHLNKKIPT